MVLLCLASIYTRRKQWPSLLGYVVPPGVQVFYWDRTRPDESILVTSGPLEERPKFILRPGSNL